MKRLDGKVAIITGGASGIGAAGVRLFSENGAKVIIADIQDDLGQKLADQIGPNVDYIHCDVSKEEDIINLINSAVQKYGKLDIMYNNAGIIDGIFTSILDTEKSDLEKLLSVNLIGPILGAKHAAKVMIPQKKGCILFTASACVNIAGLGTHSYAATKHGVSGLTRNLAAELGEYGLRVNCVSPYAVVDTGISKGVAEVEEEAAVEGRRLIGEVSNLKGKVLKADDVARAALFLANDDEAGYISGVNLVIDGGFSVVNPTMMNAYAQFLAK